ncbi:hypothetical protein AB0O76_12140 [Streptomyces sp. NPDC086554]|uniref:CHAT domain-containing protein n=1 Tax=Streptomyces sp. NPDC086554 TaxID=3154864 RepID=UPI00343D9027
MGQPHVEVSRAEQACAAGESALERGDRAVAEREFRAALTLAGDGADAAGIRARAHIGIGRLRLAAKDPEEAAEEFRRAHALRPDEAGPLHWLGCAAAHGSAYESADTHFTSALGRVPPHHRSLVQRAYVRVRLGRHDEALKDLRTAASQDASLDAEARRVMAALAGATAQGVALPPRGAGQAEAAGAAEDPPEPGGPAGTQRRRAADLPAASRRPQGRVEVDSGSVPRYAVALVLGGQREAAVELLEEATRQNPADHRITHTLAIALLNSPTGQGELATRRWERAVAAWGALLYDDAFWAHRRACAEARYGVPIETALVTELRADLRDLLEGRMPDDAEGRVSPGALLRREVDAARVLARAGGFPTGHGDPLACGPLRIAELRMVAEFGAFAVRGESGGTDLAADGSEACGTDTTATWGDTGSTGTTATWGDAGGTGATATDTERGGGTRMTTATGPTHQSRAYAADGESGGTDPAAQDGRTAPPPRTGASLTYAFSELGLAQLLLKQEQPAEALGALAELRCPGCRERQRQRQRQRGSGVGAAVCEPGCGRFDELNPAYAGYPDKHRRLALDARGLALRARIQLGSGELTAGRPDFGAATASWRRALVHSRELDRYQETHRTVVDLALSAARAAHRAGDLTRAVATLEAVRVIIGANERGRIEGQLARLLADRGIAAANRDGTLLDGPAADLRRSVAFNPHLLRAQVSLGVVLRGLAARRWHSGSASGARATLQEAMEQLTAALVHFPGDPELTEQHEAAVADLGHVTAVPHESGR